MAVKGFKIIESRQLVLCCDLCDAQIPESNRKFKSDASQIALGQISELATYWYEYTCPNCGHVQKSKNSYPCQSTKFDLDDVLILEDAAKLEE